ncbi:MAG: thioredoxin family protein [Pseudorhodobacter sp.]|nr:thioredoxin family protein [Pseudorhodobacter sp.]
MIRSTMLFLAAMMLPAAASAELLLVMVEQPGCIYCRKWDNEIAAKYPLTDEGKAAPLTRIQLRAPLAEGMVFDRPAIFTPTFVLVDEGGEVGRIEGYPGEDFFWALLGQMLIAQRTGETED